MSQHTVLLMIIYIDVHNTGKIVYFRIVCSFVRRRFSSSLPQRRLVLIKIRFDKIEMYLNGRRKIVSLYYIVTIFYNIASRCCTTFLYTYLKLFYIVSIDFFLLYIKVQKFIIIYYCC